MKRTGLLLLSLLVTFSLFAGGQAPREAAAPAPTGERESPMLAARVAANELPPLEERLPNQPYVAKVSEGLGRYGGNLRLISNEQTKLGDGRMAVTVAALTKADTDTATTLPHLAKEFRWEDNKTLVFTLREGVKWSDGAPLTTEDVRFWWFDYQINKELRPSGPHGHYVTPGGIMELDIVDKYTFKMRFNDPHPLMHELQALFSEFVPEYPIMPAHYMKQYHKAYAEKAALERLMSAGNFADWTQLFTSRIVAYWDTRSASTLGAPSLHSYILTEIGPNYFKMERNPYYWKVDTQGRQLPYIDTIHIQVVSAELYHGKVAAGEVDFAARRSDLKELALYKSGEAAGN